MGLFDKKPPEEPEQPAEQVPVGDAERRDMELAAQKKMEDKEWVQFNTTLITPTKLMRGDDVSEPHQVLTKDLTITNISEHDVGIGCLYLSLVNHLIFLKMYRAAETIHAEFEGWLSLKCSVDGFGRESLIKTIIARGQVANKDQKRSGFKFMG